MRMLAIFAAFALATSAQAASDYPPGLFEKSPEINGDSANGLTHLPDGRWVPNQPQGSMCDFEHHCYPDTSTEAATPPPPVDSPLTASPSPSMASSPMCDEIRHRLFRDLYEVEKAHRICGP